MSSSRCRSNAIPDPIHWRSRDISLKYDVSYLRPAEVAENQTEKNKRSKSDSDIDTQTTDEFKAAVFHSKTNTSSYFSFEDLIKTIKVLEEKKDALAIKNILNAASSNDIRKLCESLCVEKPKNDFISDIVSETIVEKFCKGNESKFTIVNIWTGYRSVEKNFEQLERQQLFARYKPFRRKRGIDTLVVVVEQNIQRKTGSFCGLDLIIVSKDECNSEAASLLSFEFCDTTDSSVIQIDDETIALLFNQHSNITLINKSNVRSKGYKSGAPHVEKTPTIVIYCQIKGVVPRGEETFPEKINGFIVDVREGTCRLAVNPLRPGEKITDEVFKTTGTLGGFVNIQNPRKVGFLTCAHVVLPPKILQNNSAEEYVRKKDVILIHDREKRQIGKINKIMFIHDKPNEVSIDAALIEITDRHPCDGYFADVYLENQLHCAGFSDRQILHFSNGQLDQINMFNFRKQVIKVGATSGITLGSLRIGRSCAQIINDCEVILNKICPIRLFGQLEVIPRIDPSQPSDSSEAFLSEGDSGALVFVIARENPVILKCIGIAVAKTSYGACLMTPIDKVFDALGLSYNCFTKFSTPNSYKETDEEGLQDVLASITQKLTDMHSNMATKQDISNMATKKDIQNLKRDLESFNSRLNEAEERIRKERKTGKNEDKQ
ncbi:uncharacterized protein LOC133174551 [Saccostrea echinata]|uniref:uncharacterized protein LOC133174551 n=1 Tax=Saccostrea echinata TaxID=191078 RepID=UPI002A8203C6|nr:uncharacterized protein LOC133174551 [Saccostrea echinata]